MARSRDNWVGDTDDTRIPTRVRLRVWDRCAGRCHRCRRQIRAGEKWTLEHLIALCNGGTHTEDNFGLTCCNCLAAKNAEDVAEKSMIARKRQKHLGIKPKGRGFRKPNGVTFDWSLGRYVKP